MARRSNKYAGTRFLKRGANWQGDVANEVETEQIVHDPNSAEMYGGRFSSFVQMRGSVPCHWSQNVEKNRLPKPPISIDVNDPYAITAGRHFNELFRRFGSPVIGLNLVKRSEKKARESLLDVEYNRIIKQLNVTLPSKFKLKLVNFDMALSHKDVSENTMHTLSNIAYKMIKKTGIYFSHPPLHTHHFNPDEHMMQFEQESVFGDKNFGKFDKHPKLSDRGRYQTGLVRVNCVDCLDRTNTAQFAIGKCALAFQLYWLGEVPSPGVNLDIKLLDQMYEDHGDVLAVQYGGSQLVHRLATYRGTAPLASHGNDMKQSMTRYLANAFSDTVKQQAINLFLGVYQPLKYHQIMPLSTVNYDTYLHQSYPDICHRPNAAQWWDSEVMDCLPLSCNLLKKTSNVANEMAPDDQRIDLFADLHTPPENKSLTDLEWEVCNVKFSKEIFKPTCKKKNSKVSITSRKSISPYLEESEEDEIVDSLDVSKDGEEKREKSIDFTHSLSEESLLTDSSLTYGNITESIDESSMKDYEKYISMGQAISAKRPVEDKKSISYEFLTFEPLDDYRGYYDFYEIEDSVLCKDSMNICEVYLKCNWKTKAPSKNDLMKYHNYSRCFLGAVDNININNIY